MARTKLQTPNFRLTKRKDGYYTIRYEENGATKTRATGTKDANEAEKARARFVNDYQKPSMAGNPTVATLCDAYFDYRSPMIARPKNMHFAHVHIKRLLGDLYAASITQTAVNNYIKTRRSENIRQNCTTQKIKPVTDATINKELSAMRAAIRWAASEGKLDKEVSFRIEVSKGAIRDRWITKEEANLLVNAASPHVALFLRIALGTAKRREAILSLTWDRVVLAPQGNEYIDFGDDVGKKRRGKTPISQNPPLIAALKRAKDSAITPYVIEFRGRKAVDVKTALTATCRRAGVPRITAHVLKHTAITWMVQDGATYEEISKLANTSKEIIERVYGHHSPSFLARAASALTF